MSKIETLLNALDAWQVETTEAAFKIVEEIYENTSIIADILDTHENVFSGDSYSLVDFFETHDDYGTWNPKE